MRSPRLKEDKLVKMVNTYLRGREESTMNTYQSAYRRLVELCEKCGASVFDLCEERRCELWMEAREAGLSVATIRGVSAVMSMIREAMGMKEDASGRERTLKRSLAKEKNLEKKRKKKRRAGTIGDVKALVKEARRSGDKGDWRTSAMAVMCFFGCRRLGDLLRVRVEDVTWEEENVQVYLRRHKTDVENEGSQFSMVGRGRAFDIRGFLLEYLARMGVSGKQAVFPKSLGKGDKRVAVSYSILYQSLEDMKTRLGLDETLKWHSFRIGAATRGNGLGVRRTVVKAAGMWRSSVVDQYCREEEPGVVLSEALANSWV